MHVGKENKSMMHAMSGQIGEGSFFFEKLKKPLGNRALTYA